MELNIKDHKDSNLMPSITKKFLHKKEPRNFVLKKDINLLPKKILAQRQFDTLFKKICIISLKICIAAFALLIVPIVFRLSLGFDKSSLEQKIEQAMPIEDLEKEVVSSRAKLKNEQQLITDIDNNDSIISVLLTTMEKVIPKTLYLTSISQDAVDNKTNDPKAAGSQNVIKISGVAKDKDSVADFQRSLKETSMYKDVFVTNIQEIDERLQDMNKITETNEFGDTIEKEVPSGINFRVKVQFEMQCILNDWK